MVKDVKKDDALADVAGVDAAVSGDTAEKEASSVGVPDHATLSPLARAKVVNALRSLPAGYAFHSSAPIGRAIAWAESHAPQYHNAAVEIVASIGAWKPDAIGGSGWIVEADLRMRYVMGAVDAGAAGQVGMDGAALARKIEQERAARGRAVAAVAAEQNAELAARADGKRNALADAFAPAGLPAAGTVALDPSEVDEDMTGD